MPVITLPSRVRPGSSDANGPLIPALTMQVTADAKFVDLGADSLDTVRAVLCALFGFCSNLRLAVSSKRGMAWALTACVLRAHSGTTGRQVEIMMALEETFDLQLDEEGKHVLALITLRLRPVTVSLGKAGRVRCRLHFGSVFRAVLGNPPQA